MPSFPAKRSVDSIKSQLLNPALTSHFYCRFYAPTEVRDWMAESASLGYGSPGYDSMTQIISIACMDASLPGSSLMTHEQSNDFHGITQRIAYRRDYGSGVDFTFIVDAQHYLIAFFENWMRYIVNEKVEGQRGKDRESVDDYPYINDARKSYSRVHYYDNYSTGELVIQKFERDYQESGGIQYNFLRAYPISISAMPVSYEASQLLKCTVTFTYTRHYASPINPEPPDTPAPPAETEPGPTDELRDDWAIWYMTWGRSRRDILTPAQKAFGDRVEGRISSDSSYLSGLRSRAALGTYTVPGPTGRPGSGPGPLRPAGRPLGDLTFISSPGRFGSTASPTYGTSGL